MVTQATPSISYQPMLPSRNASARTDIGSPPLNTVKS
jgi:hypothetical protein